MTWLSSRISLTRIALVALLVRLLIQPSWPLALALVAALASELLEPLIPRRPDPLKTQVERLAFEMSEIRDQVSKLALKAGFSAK